MDAKHTPGPWKLLPAGEDACGDTHSFDYVEVAHKRYVTSEGRSDVEANANACLIAAAPELLEALMLLLREEDAGTVCNLDRATARAAIAKATGAQP